MNLKPIGRPVLFLALLAFSATSAVGEGRINSTSMTCKEAKRLVKDQGVVEMQAGASRFERVVSHRRHCLKDQILKRYFAPTSDNKRCKVGNICEFSAGKS